MPELNVSVGGRSYLVACDEGQQDRLQSLAAYMEEKVQVLVRSTRQAADQRLLVMAALLIADELFDCQAAKDADSGLAHGGDKRLPLLLRQGHHLVTRL